jgi:hypothetical protein
MRRPILPALLATLVFGHAAFAQTTQTSYTPSSTDAATATQPVFPADAPTSHDCGGGGVCGPDGRVWADAEYLFWWVRGMSLPPLVTTSPAGTPQGQAGVLGTPGAHVLFGGSLSDGAARSGGRFTLGTWLDCDQKIGIEGSYFLLEAKSNNFFASSNGSAILARPFINANTGAQDSQLVSFPGLVSGSVGANSTSGLFEGAGVLGRYNLCCGCCYRVDLVGGYRYLHFRDGVDIDEAVLATSTSTASLIAPGTTFNVSDHFHTSNQLNAFDVGLTGEVRRGPWSLGWLTKLAVGQNHETIDVNGATVVTVPGSPPVISAGGLLALPTNIGRFERNQASLVPEVGLKVGYQVTPGVRVNLGYTFLYWSEVVRAGQQIDTVINPNLLPPPVIPTTGPLRPAPLFESSNIWVQGISLGVELRF